MKLSIGDIQQEEVDEGVDRGDVASQHTNSAELNESTTESS